MRNPCETLQNILRKYFAARCSAAASGFKVSYQHQNRLIIGSCRLLLAFRSTLEQLPDNFRATFNNIIHLKNLINL